MASSGSTFPKPGPARSLPPPAVLARMSKPQRRRLRFEALPWRGRILSWTLNLAYRHLRRRERAGRPFPAEEQLAEALEEMIRKHGKRFIVSFHDDPHPLPARFPSEHVETLARAAARKALAGYDPEIYVRAERGGRASRRGPTFTVDHLDALAIDGFEGSIAETAATLGCSEATVSRLRTERRAARKDRQTTG